MTKKCFVRGNLPIARHIGFCTVSIRTRLRADLCWILVIFRMRWKLLLESQNLFFL